MLLVEVRLFAKLREASGRDSIYFEFDAPPTVEEVLTRMFEEVPELGKILLRKCVFDDRYKVMVGQDLVPPENFSKIVVNSMMAVLPPVSGG